MVSTTIMQKFRKRRGRNMRIRGRKSKRARKRELDLVVVTKSSLRLLVEYIVMAGSTLSGTTCT
jgi:hypothetical protein